MTSKRTIPHPPPPGMKWRVRPHSSYYYRLELGRADEQAEQLLWAHDTELVRISSWGFAPNFRRASRHILAKRAQRLRPDPWIGDL